MNSIRIHSTAAAKSGYVPFMILEAASDEAVTLDFCNLSEGTMTDCRLALTADQLYEILEGKPRTISTDQLLVRFLAEGEVLTIAIFQEQQEESDCFKVWASELGLAWNLLCRSTQK